MPKTYFIKTYGCQMNVSDAERIAGLLEKNNYRPASKAEQADLVVFVACSVRQSAMDRIYGQARQIKKLKIKNKKLTIALTGCLLEKDKKELADKFDIIFDIKNLNTLSSLLNKIPKKLKNYHRLGGVNGASGTSKLKSYFHVVPARQSLFSAFVPIMTGCNNFCSYCVVPYARGREISRPAEEIIKEIKNLVKSGYKEITLLGQNVNSYANHPRIKHESNTNKNANDFPELLRKINAIPGNFWIRFLTSHPKDMSDELIKTITECEKICESIHLPAQSGDNAILKKMNRKYTIGHYKNLIKKIRPPATQAEFAKALRAGRAQSPLQAKALRNGLPGAAVSTDLIVGFPGETKKQFQNTAKLMRKIKFDMAYLAQYSPRAQTAAYKLKDNVPKAEKKRRENILTEILAKTALENNKKYIDRTVEILLEKKLSTFNFQLSTYFGHTRTGKNVKIAESHKVIESLSHGVRIGNFIKVKITAATPWGLEGKLA